MSRGMKHIRVTKRTDKSPEMDSVSKSVQLDVVELLKQVLRWTPHYKPGLDKALLQAAKVGSAGCVKVLISAGADVDSEDDNGDTPFVHAFRGKHIEVMEMLKDAGCTTEIVKMSLALATGDKEFVRFCYDLDIPVENEDWGSVGEAEINILLEELKIDPFVGQYGRHGYADSPFMYLAQEGPPDILHLLVKKHPCIKKYIEDDVKEKMNNALHKAISNGRLDNVRLLLDVLGADLEAKDSRDRSAFLAACEYNEEIALTLIDNGANVFLTDREGMQPLHWAAKMGYFELVKILIAKGHDIEKKSKFGITPLMESCSNGKFDVSQLLIEKGANVNSSTPEGWTPLHLAVWGFYPIIVHLLTQSGACPDNQTNGLTFNNDVVPGGTPLLIAISRSSMKTFRHLLDANCDLEQAGLVVKKGKDESLQICKMKPIQFAVTSHNWDFVELLIRAGTDIRPVISMITENQQQDGSKSDDEDFIAVSKLAERGLKNPPSLKDIVRRWIRRKLGYNLVTKVKSLPCSLAEKDCIMFYDLFQPSLDGSFEI